MSTDGLLDVEAALANYVNVHEAAQGHSTTSTPKADPNTKGKKERRRQQLVCADCHKRKQKCDRKMPCSECVQRGVGHLCHIAPAGSNKAGPQDGNEGSPKPPRKRRKRNEIEAAAARELIIARARAVLGKAVLGDAEAIGQLQHFLGEATYANDPPSYVGPAAIQTFIGSAGYGPTQFFSDDTDALTNDDGPHMLNQLPQRPLVDHLIQAFMKFAPTFYVIQYSLVELEKHIENLWRVVQLRQNPTSPDLTVPATTPMVPVTHSVIALVLMACTLALQHLSPEAAPFVAMYGDVGILRRHFYALAREALVKAEMQELPDLPRIEAITMMGSYLKNEGRPNDQYILHASAIRCAQALGMHRQASSAWRLEPFEQEMRNRVWTALYSYDRYSSFHLGRPPVINDLHCDADLPRNLDVKDLRAGNLDKVKPLQEYTDSTLLICQCQLGAIVGRIFNRAFSIRTPDYGTVLELDAELQTLENALPPALRTPTANDKLKHPGIEQVSRMFLAILCKIRTMLHRPFLLKPQPPPGDLDQYEYSRQITIMLSRQQIGTLRNLIEDLPDHLKNNFLYSHLLWEAGCQLAIAIRAMPLLPENFDEAKKLDFHILQARQLLEHVSARNRTAGNAMRMIDFLRSRYTAHWSFDETLLSIDPSLGSSESPGLALTPLTSSNDEDDPLNYLNLPLSMPEPGQKEGFPSSNEFSKVGQVFDTNVNWQQNLEQLLEQVGELR